MKAKRRKPKSMRVQEPRVDENRKLMKLVEQNGEKVKMIVDAQQMK